MNRQTAPLTLSEARAALIRDPTDPFLFTVVAWHEERAGNHDAAHKLLAKALKIAPADPSTLTALAALYRVQGRLRDAVLRCDQAIAAAPTHAPAWLERGFILSTGGSFDMATQSYANAARLDPGLAPAWAGMAMIAARRGNRQDVRASAAKALSLDPDNLIAQAALGTVEIEDGDYLPVVARLDPLLGDGEHPSSQRANALNVLGDALDRLDRTDEAFDTYKKAKAEFASVHAAQFPPDRETHREFMERICTSLANSRLEEWAVPSLAPIQGAAARHVFLLGYPRSGTTLVENILASLPEVAALEERPTLRESDEAFLSDSAGFATLSALTTASADAYRTAYWAKVAAAGLDIVGKAFVDMDPLKGIRLPIIARLFPEARIVIMRRDPRDIVWSCFHTNFALTSTSYEFTSLERTARHYDALMRLTELSLEKLPLTTHEVRYDMLVSDFDATTQQLCAFLGLPWSSELRQFGRTARNRGVSTASAAQVLKPLYDGTQQWRRYAKHLEPVMPILEPWIDKLGFAE